jgi:hypothetical protein
MTDVTDEVYFEENDGEYLTITQCVCGERFPAWEFIINIYPDYPSECPKCGAKLYFSNSIRVYRIEEALK